MTIPHSFHLLKSLVKRPGAGLQDLHSTAFQSHPCQCSYEEQYARKANDLLANGFNLWDCHQQWQQQTNGN